MERRMNLFAGLAGLVVLSAALAYEPVQPSSSDKTQSPATGSGSRVIPPEATIPADAREEEIEIMRRLLQSALERHRQPVTLKGRVQSAAFSPDGRQLAVEGATTAVWDVSNSAGPYWQVDYASSKNALPGHEHVLDVHGAEGVYLKGYGVVYTTTMLLPAITPVIAQTTSPAPQPLSDWERTQRELRGEKNQSAPAPARESLADTVLKVLAKNGHHFTKLEESEQITVAITLRNSQNCMQCHIANTMTGATVNSDAGWAASIFLNDRNFDMTRPGRTPNVGSNTILPGNNVKQPLPIQDDAARLDAAKAESQKQVLLGDLHMKQGKNDQAAAAYEAALKIYRDNLEYWRRLRTLKPGNFNIASNADAMENEYRLAATKLLQVYAAQGKKQEMQQMLKKLDAELANASAADGAAKPPAPAAQKQVLPAKLVISAPKKLLEMAGAGKITFEEFRKNATVDYQPAKTIDYQPAKSSNTE